MMHELFDQDSAIVPNIGKPKRGFYIDPKMLIGGMFEMTKFEAQFKKYHL